ncbi:MAG: hypothetical protein PHQ89_03645 [Bacilli bacterium]|nr:hypothetical protein [Bacilli bacterium]
MNRNMKDVLLYFSMKYEGHFEPIYEALRVKEDFNQDEFIKLKKDVQYNYVTMIDDKYPDFLKLQNCPPFVIYYQGNLNLIDTDLPVKYEMLESGHRMISVIAPNEKDGKLVFDYVVGSENEKELTKLIDHIKGKGLDLKNYDKTKKKELER